MFRFKATTFVIHAAGWLLFLLFPLLFLNNGEENNTGTILSSPYYWLFGLTYISLFYLNAGYLVPRLLLKRKYLDYGIVVLTLFSFVYYMQPFDKLLGHHNSKNGGFQTGMYNPGPSQMPPPPPPGSNDVRPPGSQGPFGPPPQPDMRMHDPARKPGSFMPILQHRSHVDLVSLFLFSIIMALSISIRTVIQWEDTEQKVIRAEAEKANAELSFLKAQINPHFLFNTLNNIYTLSVTNSEHTSDSIMKLSNIMRYVTDDVTENFVPLQDDVDCIKNYIDLQRLRLGSKTHLNFSATGIISNQKIAPLILMSFVENTFKYGISKQEYSIIDIAIEVNESQIKFYCKNQNFSNQTALTERTGIGIANTRQRLAHLYPDKHNLTIDTADKYFTVTLTLYC